MTNSEGGVGLWQYVWKYRFQVAQDRPVFQTLDIPQRLQVSGGNEVWLGLSLVLDSRFGSGWQNEYLK